MSADLPPPAGAVELAGSLAREVVASLAPAVAGGPRGDVRAKAHAADLVTSADIAVEARVRAAIHDRFPDHRINGEEAGSSGPEQARHTWWLDPVDGTSNFATCLPWASFSLALTIESHPVLGVVADLFRGEIYQASSTTPATLDGQAVRCSAATDLAGGLVLTEWAAHEPWPGMAEMLGALSTSSATTRIMGSSALSLASVAAGRCLGAVIGAFSPIDDLAGAYIASRAGATVLTVDGTWTPSSGGIAVAAPGVADQLSPMLAWTS